MTLFEDLVVLMYADNNCYTSVVSFETAIRKHKSFCVDLDEMKWRYDGKEYDIGESRYIEQFRHFGVIGVYMKYSIEQLNNMVRESQNATDTYNYSD